MQLDHPRSKREKLGTGWMALALVLAAFTGAALGLVWQSAGFGADEVAEAPPENR